MVQQASPQHRTIGKPRGCSVYSGLLPVPPVTTELVRVAYTLSDSSSYKNTKEFDGQQFCHEVKETRRESNNYKAGIENCKSGGEQYEPRCTAE